MVGKSACDDNEMCRVDQIDFPPNLQKQTKIRGKNKNKSVPEVLRTQCFLAKTGKQEFQQNKTEATKSSG